MNGRAQHSTGRDAGVDILVLGTTGMLGSALAFELPRMTGRVIHGTERTPGAAPAIVRAALGEDRLHALEVTDFEAVQALVERLRPRMVINAVGMVKQAPGLADASLTVRLNSLLPHVVAEACEVVGSRFVQVSTDCVFSGRRGMYTEADLPDPVDFYGRSKLAGETGGSGITIRTSIIGPELSRHTSLLDWFLAQPMETVRGFTGAIYSGVTTFEFARFVADTLFDSDLSGTHHLVSEPITKYELLRMIAREYGRVGEMQADHDFFCDRSMSGDQLFRETGYRAPDWPTMLAEMQAAHRRWHAGREVLV